MAEYALRTMSRPLGIETYTVTPQLPVSYQNDLPSPEQIAARLQGWVGHDDDDEGGEASFLSIK